MDNPSFISLYPPIHIHQQDIQSCRSYRFGGCVQGEVSDGGPPQLSLAEMLPPSWWTKEMPKKHADITQKITMMMTESWQNLSPFWNCSIEPQKNQILILDHSEYMMKATMFEKSVITILIYPNIKIPTDCPPMHGAILSFRNFKIHHTSSQPLC